MRLFFATFTMLALSMGFAQHAKAPGDPVYARLIPCMQDFSAQNASCFASEPIDLKGFWSLDMLVVTYKSSFETPPTLERPKPRQDAPTLLEALELQDAASVCPTDATYSGGWTSMMWADGEYARPTELPDTDFRFCGHWSTASSAYVFEMMDQGWGNDMTCRFLIQPSSRKELLCKIKLSEQSQMLNKFELYIQRPL